MLRLVNTYPLPRDSPITSPDIPPAWDRHRGKSLVCLEMPTQRGSRVLNPTLSYNYPLEEEDKVCVLVSGQQVTSGLLPPTAPLYPRLSPSRSSTNY